MQAISWDFWTNQKKLAMVLLVVYVVSMIHKASSTIYYIRPDDASYSSKNIHSFGYYIMNSKNFFTSHTKL